LEKLTTDFNEFKNDNNTNFRLLINALNKIEKLIIVDKPGTNIIFEESFKNKKNSDDESQTYVQTGVTIKDDPKTVEKDLTSFDRNNNENALFNNKNKPKQESKVNSNMIKDLKLFH